jgi:GNAT superfamily N-acetyltransferase
MAGARVSDDVDGDLMLRRAAASDAADIVRLINAAFAVERFFIDGDRIDAAEAAGYLDKGVFLILERAGEPVGCVYVELRGERGYFGLLSVDPTRQRAGIGRRLVAAAEEFCRAAGCTAIDIRVVNLRTELPPIYRRLGYVETGTEPFPADLTRQPCHFVLMTKPLA